MADHTFAIFCILFVIVVILYLVASEGAFRYSDGKYEWVRRELRLTHALLKDCEKVSRSAELVTRTASQFSDSDQIQDGTSAQVLNESEKGWIKKARESVVDATPCLQSFKNLRNRRNAKWLLSIVLDIAPRFDAALKMKRFDETINDNLGVDQIEKKVCASGINKSVEQSRSMIRSLLDRSSVHEVESAKFRPPVGTIKADELTSSLKTLSTRHPYLMQGQLEVHVKSTMMHLQLLHAFMEDVHGLEVLESEMENTWVMEANDTISQAKDVIDTINATENKRGWISEPNNWIRRWKHREDIVSVGTRISGLLTTKERFGVNFIKFIESSKSAHHCPKHQAFQHPTEPDIGLSDAVNNIRNLLDQLPKTSTKLVSQVSKVNEELDKLLEHTKETEEYAVNLRNASWKLLKKTASEANEQYQKTASKFLSKTILVRIKNAVNVLERCLKVYSIDAREESCSVVGLDEDIHELVSRLTTNSEPASSIIPIVGMKGIGKTTLAKQVYYHAKVKDNEEQEIILTE